MVSVKNEINDILLNTVNDLESRLEDSRTILTDIQSKMDSKVSEAKEYKVSVDDAKEKIKGLEEEIKSLESDLIELKDKYGKKNLVAVIEAGTKEINLEIKKKQEEIQVHKNKIAELTNRARSIKDLLLNLKKDKKIKEERLEELEICTKYYKVRLEEIVEYSSEHDNLDDYFENNTEVSSDTANVFEDIVGIDEKEEVNDVEVEETNVFDEVSIAEADEVFNEVINSDDEDEDAEEETELVFEDTVKEDEAELENEEKNPFEEETEETDELLSINEDDLEETSLQIDDLISTMKEPLEISDDKEIDKIDNINKAIDDEFENIFGKSINEPIKTMDIFGNEYVESEDSEADVVSKLTNIGLDYYSFTETDRNLIKNNFNEQIIKDIVEVLQNNKIQLDNVYVDGSILSNIAPSELSSIINKLINCGQSSDAIGYVLDKLPLVDAKKLDTTISNYGDYIKNVDIADIIVKSLKGDK